MFTKALAVLAAMASTSHPGWNVGIGFATATAVVQEEGDGIASITGFDMAGLHNSTGDTAANITVTSCEDLAPFSLYTLTGSPLHDLKEDCMEGTVNTTEQFKAKLEEYSNPHPRLTVDEQVAKMAEEICAKIETNSDIEQEIIDVCMEEPRNDDHVIDTVVRIEWAKNDETELLPELGVSCHNMAENRDEINAGLEILRGRSSGRRRLNGEDGPKTTWGYAVDVVEMMDCFCDESNELNYGCTIKFLRFLEDSMDAVKQSVNEAALSPKLFSNLEESLNKQSTHLRKSAPPGYKMTEDDMEALVERALADSDSDLFVGKCNPPGVQATNTGYSVCLYAGPYFTCEASLSRYSATCPTAGCSAGGGISLVGEVQYCIDKNEITVEMKICVEVISDVLDIIGNHISSVADVLAEFNIYGGCYRLGILTYNTYYQRLSLDVPKHYQYFMGVVRAGAGGAAHMRLRSGSRYNDDYGWFSRDWLSYHNSGLVTYTPTTGFLPTTLWKWLTNKNENWSTKTYVWFQVDFSVEIFNPLPWVWKYERVFGESPSWVFKG